MSALSSSDKLKNYLQSIVSLSALSFPNCNYFSESDFIKEIEATFSAGSGQFNKFSIFHLNIRSLNANHEKLFQLMALLKFPFDIIALSEIWSFNISMYSSLFPDYNFFYSLSKTSAIGGVGMYVHKSFTVTLRHDIYFDCTTSENIVESLFIDVVRSEFKSLIGCVYRHPNGNIGKFSDSLDCLLNSSCFKKGLKNCVLTGDINLDILKLDSNSVIASYIDVIISNNFQLLSVLPTRVTETSSTLIDHVYFRNEKNDNNFNLDSGINGCLLTDISDHFANVLVMPLKLNRSTPAAAARPLTRIFSDANKLGFAKELSEIDCVTFFDNCLDVNIGFKKFMDYLTQ